MRISDWSSDVCSSDLINGKNAFDGDVWQWHQDYGTWLNDDLMPTPRAMNVAIFLDEVNEHNGPLMFIPGSHRLGVLEAGHDLTRSEEHTSELQSLMRISYAVFCLKKKTTNTPTN